MADSRRQPERERPPDVEIGATARAKRLRFSEKPEGARTDFHGDSIASTESGSDRENLPDEVEENVTYRDVRIGWRAAAWVENAVPEADDGDSE